MLEINLQEIAQRLVNKLNGEFEASKMLVRARVEGINMLYEELVAVINKETENGQSDQQQE